MREEEIRELSALDALGALDGDEARDLEARLKAASEDVRREAREMREVAAQLALAPPSASAPPDMKQRLLARVRQESGRETSAAPPSASEAARTNVVPFPTRPRRESGPRWLLAAATVAFAALSGVLLWQNSRLAAQRDEMAREVEALTSELGDQRQEVIARQQELNAITSPTTRVIPLSGDASAPQASAKLVWDQQNSQWVIYFHGLPAAPPDKAYQLWYITADAQKIPARVFTTDAQGRVQLRVSVPRDIVPRLAVAAVTLEPKDGSAQPTGPIYLKGVI
jgi:cell division protein FtsB